MPFFNEAGVVDDQHTVVRTEVLGDVCMQVITSLVGLHWLQDSKCRSPSGVA